MEILATTDGFDSESAITIGVFDGVHVGHQKLLGQLDAASKKQQLSRVVVTFDVHPLSIIAPGHDPKMLTSLDRKLELLEKTGLVDAVVVVPFNAVRAAQSANDFIQEILIDQLNARQILIGENFRFGHERRGNFSLLQRTGAQNNFEVQSVELQLSDGEFPVSSTRIRQYISVGDVVKAKHLLGRPHEINGLVVRGDSLGTELGYPTANTEVQDVCSVPSDGVYAGEVTPKNGETYASAISIGVRPMFHEDNIRVIEPYLLDFQGDLYDQNLNIKFVSRLRDQMVLESTEALIAQIDRDVQKVRNLVKL